MALRCRCRGEPRHCSAPPFPSGATSSVLSTWWLPGADRPATHSGPVVMRSSGTVLIFCFIGFENMLRTGWLSHRIITEECVVTTFHTRGLLVYKENVTRVSMLPFSRRHPARKPHHRQLGPCSQVHKAKVWPRQPEGPCSPGFGGPASIGLEVSFPPPLPRLATLSPSHLQHLYSGTLPFCHFPRDFACSWAIWSLRGDFAGLCSAQRGTGGLVSPSHFFEDILAILVFTCQVGALLPSFNTPDKLVS